jgi:hypothetical protein
MATTAEPTNYFAASHPAMSWRSTIAGLLVSLIVFATLLSLGIALGGISLADGASLKNSGIMGGLWLLFSVLLSLFAGSYFSARVSNFTAPWVGMAQGAVLAALFIGVVLWQFFSAASWMTQSAATLMGNAASVGAQYGAPAAESAVSSLNINVNNLIEDNLDGVQFKGDPSTVMAGVASRIINGNPGGAKRYLVQNSNLTTQEVNQRIDQLQTQVTKALDDARVATANALKVTGWSLFAMMVLGLLVSISAGVMGALANSEEPAVQSTLPGFRPVRV